MTSIGRYRIDIENFDQPIFNSPNYINVYDPNLVSEVNIPEHLIVGSENSIEGFI